MKTSNKLLLGLFIVIIIISLTNIFLVKNAVIKKLNINTEQKIELEQK